MCGEDIARDAHRWIHDETVDVVHEVMPRVVRAIPVHEVELQRVVGLLLRVVGSFWWLVGASSAAAHGCLERKLPSVDRSTGPSAGRGRRLYFSFSSASMSESSPLLRLRLEAFLVLVVFVRVLARVLVVVGGRLSSSSSSRRCPWRVAASTPRRRRRLQDVGRARASDTARAQSNFQKF